MQQVVHGINHFARIKVQAYVPSIMCPQNYKQNQLMQSMRRCAKPTSKRIKATKATKMQTKQINKRQYI